MPGLADIFRAAIGSSKTDTVNALRNAANIADTFDAFSGDSAQAMLLNVLLPWAALVARSAVRKWGTQLSVCHFDHNGVRCQTKPIGQCHACGRPICLAHAFVGADATLICWPCMKVGAANAKPWQSTNGEPGPESQSDSEGPGRLQWAYVVLGVSPDSSDDEVQMAYRTHVRLNHPDRAVDDEDVKSRTEKLKMINIAKQVIWKHRGL